MLWSFLILATLLAYGVSMMWLEWRNQKSYDELRWYLPVCLRCGRDSKDAWCSDCADYLQITL